MQDPDRTSPSLVMQRIPNPNYGEGDFKAEVRADRERVVSKARKHMEEEADTAWQAVYQSIITPGQPQEIEEEFFKEFVGRVIPGALYHSFEARKKRME